MLGQGIPMHSAGVPTRAPGGLMGGPQVHIQCFVCGGMGHWARHCPQAAVTGTLHQPHIQAKFHKWETSLLGHALHATPPPPVPGLCGIIRSHASACRDHKCPIHLHWEGACGVQPAQVSTTHSEVWQKFAPLVAYCERVAPPFCAVHALCARFADAHPCSQCMPHVV